MNERNLIGDGWQKDAGSSYEGTVLEDWRPIAGSGNSRGSQLRDACIDVANPAAEPPVHIQGNASMVYAGMDNVNINCRNRCDDAVLVDQTMAYNLRRVFAQNYSGIGFRDNYCRGGGHALEHCHFTGGRVGAIIEWATRIIGGEYNGSEAGMICRRTDNGGERVVSINTRFEMDHEGSGLIFDSEIDKPWDGAHVIEPHLSLRVPGAIGVDMRFCNLVTVTTSFMPYRVDGAYYVRFGEEARNCTWNAGFPVERDNHFIDNSATGSGNCVISRGQIIYQS